MRYNRDEPPAGYGIFITVVMLIVGMMILASIVFHSAEQKDTAQCDYYPEWYSVADIETYRTNTEAMARRLSYETFKM